MYRISEFNSWIFFCKTKSLAYLNLFLKELFPLYKCTLNESQLVVSLSAPTALKEFPKIYFRQSFFFCNTSITEKLIFIKRRAFDVGKNILQNWFHELKNMICKQCKLRQILWPGIAIPLKFAASSIIHV